MILPQSQSLKIFLASCYQTQKASKAQNLRTEKIRILSNHPSFKVWLNYCWLAKNLYNYTLYQIYQQYNQNQTIPKYENLAHKFTIENQKDYWAFNNNNSISQQVMQQVFRNFKSYFALLRKNKGKKKTDKDFIKAKLPKYYPKAEFGLAHFSCPANRILKQLFKKEGLIQLGGLDDRTVFQSKIINSLEKLGCVQQIRESFLYLIAKKETNALILR